MANVKLTADLVVFDSKAKDAATQKATQDSAMCAFGMYLITEKIYNESDLTKVIACLDKVECSKIVPEAFK